MSVEINFADLAEEGPIDNLVGQEDGEKARRRFNLDELDASGDRVVVVIPKDVLAVSSSFWSGLFSNTVAKYGRNGFHSRYKFKAAPIMQRSVALNAAYMAKKLAN